MAAFNFTVFVDKVERREKRMTIRKTACGKPGDKIQLYTGMRTKHCRKLVDEDATLKFVTPIKIEYAGCRYGKQDNYGKGTTPHQIKTKWGELLNYGKLTNLSLADGFDRWGEMRDWFSEKYGLPFQGHIHIWHWPE